MQTLLSPTVSVIIPAFNSEDTIEDCLKSVLLQSVPPYEILVYDDFSSDATSEIVYNLTKIHPSIKLYRGSSNMGAGVARTNLLNEARGKYVAFIDADDRWNADKLERQLKYIEKNQLDICVCAYEILDAHGLRLGVRRPPKRISRISMHLADWIPTSMTVMRADLNSSKVMPAIRRRQDYAFWLILFRDNPDLKCASLDEVLGTYVRTQNSLSSNPITNIKYNYKMFRNVMNYSAFISGLCLCANIATRLFRV